MFFPKQNPKVISSAVIHQQAAQGGDPKSRDSPTSKTKELLGDTAFTNVDISAVFLKDRCPPMAYREG